MTLDAARELTVRSSRLAMRSNTGPEHWLTEKYPASTGVFVRTVVAGHVRTAELHQHGSYGVFHDGRSHYSTDAAVEEDGRLNVLRNDAATRG